MQNKISVPFNRSPIIEQGLTYIKEALHSQKLSGEGPFNQKCQSWLQDHYSSAAALLTPSCTAALEMAILLAGIKPGDEVILPSFTFPSTANSIVLFGGIPVFVDSLTDTMNIDPGAIRQAITSKTRAIMPVHYGGVSCDMEAIMKIANENDLIVIEDAAQCLGSSYQNKPVGVYAHFSALSFHETKNIVCGEGGALLINDPAYIERAEIIREKGTNRKAFLRGAVDKYSWVDLGSSYLLSEFQAAYLYAQLEKLNEITQNRLSTWYTYHDHLAPYEEKGLLKRLGSAVNIQHNAHMYAIILPNFQSCESLRIFLNARGIAAVSHYVPLHSAKAGKAFGRFVGEMEVVNNQANCLLRFPLFFDISKEQISYILKNIQDYYNRENIV